MDKKILKLVGQAIEKYRLIEENDKIMVCMSGGKDSYLMLDVLLDLQQRAPVKFDLMAFHLNQGHPGFATHILEKYLEKQPVPYAIGMENTYKIVKEKVPEGKSTCSLCSRLRRAVLYRYAAEYGMNKIALGHHREDILETTILNMFFTGQLKSMPPKLKADKADCEVIRPLALVSEDQIIETSKTRKYPILPCTLCSKQEGSQRERIKLLLAQQEDLFPGSKNAMLNSLGNIIPSHLLDTNLHSF